MDNLNELQNTVHQYRKALDAFESRTGHQPQQVEARARLDLKPLAGLDDPIVALNMGTGGGKTNLGDDTSGGSANDFTS